MVINSPYTRATYRYTPLLAFILTPNEYIHPAFGKILFSIADVLIPVVLRGVLPQSQSHAWLAVLWLFNPMPANIATRGSAESILGLLVCATLLAANKQKWFVAAILLGVSVHFKIYPFICGFSLLFAIDDDQPPLCEESNTARSSCWIRWMTNAQRIHLFLRSAATFLILSGAMYLM
jgi:phosphatidylinositol glycan class M